MLPWPTRVQIPNGISIGSAVFAQLTAVFLYSTMSRPFPVKSKLPLPIGNLDSHLKNGSFKFLGPTKVLNPPKRHLDLFSRFCRAHYCDSDRQTDRQTDLQTTLTVCNNRSQCVGSWHVRPSRYNMLCIYLFTVA